MPQKNESILNQLAALPWWIILIITVISYLALRFVLPVISFENQIISAFTQGVSKVAHLIMVPLVAVAIFSFINQLRKRKMLENQTGLDSIKDLSWKQFEELVGEALRRRGYQVLENPSQGADGGVDLRLRKNGKLVFVQCKHWKSRSVGVKIVRELYGVMAAKKATNGIVVSGGNFTKEAKEFTQGKPIVLMGGYQLLKLISEVQKSANISATVGRNVICPKCGRAMILRTAKKGNYAGKKFWGCSEFPRCRGTLKYEKEL
jgi:restriction system protein